MDVKEKLSLCMDFIQERNKDVDFLLSFMCKNQLAKVTRDGANLIVEVDGRKFTVFNKSEFVGSNNEGI